MRCFCEHANAGEVINAKLPPLLSVSVMFSQCRLSSNTYVLREPACGKLESFDPAAPIRSSYWRACEASSGHVTINSGDAAAKRSWGGGDGRTIQAELQPRESGGTDNVINRVHLIVEKSPTATQHQGRTEQKGVMASSISAFEATSLSLQFGSCGSTRDPSFTQCRINRFVE